LGWALLSGVLLNKILRMPTIAGMIIGGIALGPSCIDIARYTFFSTPVSMIDAVTGESYTILSSDLCIFFVLLISAACTVPYLLWIAGFETNLKELMHVGVVAVVAGICGAVIPVLMTAGVMCYLIRDYSCSLMALIGMGLIFAATSVSIPVAMLYAADKMHLKSSKATLGAAVVDDIIAVLLLSIFFLVAHTGNVKTTTLTQSMLYLSMSLAGLMVSGYYVIRPAVRWLSSSQHTVLMAPVATGIMLLYFGFVELVGGLAGITGAYFAGLFYRMGVEEVDGAQENAHGAQNVIAPFVNGILLPIFLGSIGLQVNIRLLGVREWGLVILLLIVAIISKMIGCFFAAGLQNTVNKSATDRWSLLDSYLFGSAMVARGEVGLIIAAILKGASVISADLYIISIVVIVLTTIVTPIMLAAGFYWHDRGDLALQKSNFRR